PEVLARARIIPGGSAPIEARQERFPPEPIFSTLLFIGIQIGMYQTALGEIPVPSRYLLAITIPAIPAIAATVGIRPPRARGRWRRRSRVSRHETRCPAFYTARARKDALFEICLPRVRSAR